MRRSDDSEQLTKSEIERIIWELKGLQSSRNYSAHEYEQWTKTKPILDKLKRMRINDQK